MSITWPRSSSRPVFPHAVAVLVNPAIAIVASSIAAATVLDTLTPHHLVSGDTVLVAGHVGSTPAVDGSRVATVIDATHVSVPVAVTIAGTGGTLTRTTAVEPLTLAQAKLYARLSGTDLDTLLPGWITTARDKVEQDTGLALLTQTRDVYVDVISGSILTLPSQSRPLQAVTSITSTDTAGAAQVLDPSNYVLDLVSGRIGLAVGGAFPSDLRSFQPYVLRITSGWTEVALIPAALVQAVGLLVDYYVNKDETALAIYNETIAPFRPVVVA